MRGLLTAVTLTAVIGGCRPAAPPPPKATPSYLFVWAGDSSGNASDFLGVINADTASPGYGSIVASLPTGTAGTHPHHTEASLGSTGHLLANGFKAGRSWLFDLTVPTTPRIITTFDAKAGFSHPHTYLRLSNGHVLATFQYAADSIAQAPKHGDHDAPQAKPARVRRTGGLVEMDERGVVIRSASAIDTAIADRSIYPYSVVEMPGIDRAVSTTTDMDASNTASTAEWVQFWRLSDLSLLKSIALRPGPRGDEHRLTGEPFLLPDGKSVYIHTFSCGLYLVRDVNATTPTAALVKSFPGADCGVPVLAGHFFLQPVPSTHSLVALDITDPEHPREVSSVSFGDGEEPHWLAIDPSGRRLVMNSGGSGASNRLFVINFDPATGALAIDQRFRDAGSALPGVRMSQQVWPHGFKGTAKPHGTVFAR